MYLSYMYCIMFLLFIFLEMPAIKLQITWQITNMTISTFDWFRHVCREVGFFFVFYLDCWGGKKRIMETLQLES